MSQPNERNLTRRTFLRNAGAGLSVLGLGAAVGPVVEKPAEPFAQRGYYMTFMRMPTYGLPQWKQMLDGIQADGGNLLVLWMGGAFRSKQFPVTWKFNEEHENVRGDFGRELIAYAHTQGIRVLLGFTPFGYDGVNQYPLEHPELKAVKKDGQLTDKFGIYCWGWNLCPSKAESQRFMREYAREMAFDFYPEADGLFIESSDYAICHCPECQGKFFEKEFEFVQAISRAAWVKKPGAMVVVYPHYFSGAKVPGFDATAARMPFDPRWTLFFTPHSAHLDATLIRQARSSLWWDEGLTLHTPEAIQRGAQRAMQSGVTGCVPSLEPYTFVATHAEEGQKYLVGKRQAPLGFGWLKPDEMPFNELPLRVNRLAYREFTRQPDMAFDEFKRRLGREIFGDASASQAVEDLLQLQRCFVHGRTWCQAPPIVDPERARAMKERGELKPEKVAEYRSTLEKIRGIATRSASATHTGGRELHRVAQWVLGRWSGANAGLLAEAPGSPVP